MLRKVLFLSLFLIAIDGTRAIAETKLKFASFVPAGSYSVTAIFDPWIKQVEEATQGEVKIQGFWSGSLGRSPFQQYKLLTGGVVDITLVLDKYTGGQFPDDAIVELPYLIRDGEEGSRARWRMFEKGLLRGYDEIKTVSVYTSDLIGIHTNKPFKLIEDLKGMKIRAGGVAGTLLLQHIGAAPVGIPTPQIAESIDRGVLDGAMLNWSGTDSFRTNNVTNFHYVAPIGVHSFIMAMNKDKWNKLSAKAKAGMDKVSGESLARLGGSAYESDGQKVIARLAADPKHTLVYETDSDIAKRRAFFQPVYDAWIKATPDGQMKLDALEAILADIRKGS